MKMLLSTTLTVLSVLSTTATLAMDKPGRSIEDIGSKQQLSGQIKEAFQHYLSFSTNDALTPDAWTSTPFGYYSSNERVREQEGARLTWKTLEAQQAIVEAHEQAKQAKKSSQETQATLKTLSLLEAGSASRIELANTTLHKAKVLYEDALKRQEAAQKTLTVTKEEFNTLSQWKFDGVSARKEAEAKTNVPELREAYDAAINALREPKSRMEQFEREFSRTVGFENMAVYKQKNELQDTVLSPLEKTKEETRQRHSAAQHEAFRLVDREEAHAQTEHSERLKDCKARLQKHEAELNLASQEYSLQSKALSDAESEAQKETNFPEVLRLARIAAEKAESLEKQSLQAEKDTEETVKTLVDTREEQILERVRTNALLRLDIVIKQRNWTMDRFNLRMSENDKPEAQRWASNLVDFDAALYPVTKLWGEKTSIAKYKSERNDRSYLEFLG